MTRKRGLQCVLWLSNNVLKHFRRAVDEAASLGIEGEADQPYRASVGKVRLRIALLPNLRKCLVHRLVHFQFEDVYALLVIIVISMFLRGGIAGTVLNIFTWIIFIYTWFRILSKNYAKRSAENRWYLEKTAAIRKFFRIKKKQQSERKDYKYFKCPECGQQLRVPRGKGHIKITCRKCGRQFTGKT